MATNKIRLTKAQPGELLTAQKRNANLKAIEDKINEIIPVLDGHAVDVPDLKRKVNQNIANITSNDADIAKNKADINDIDTRVKANKTDLDAKTTLLSTQSAEINANTSKTVNNANFIAKIEDRLDTLEGQIELDESTENNKIEVITHSFTTQAQVKAGFHALVKVNKDYTSSNSPSATNTGLSFEVVYDGNPDTPLITKPLIAVLKTPDNNYVLETNKFFLYKHKTYFIKYFASIDTVDQNDRITGSITDAFVIEFSLAAGVNVGDLSRLTRRVSAVENDVAAEKVKTTTNTANIATKLPYTEIPQKVKVLFEEKKDEDASSVATTAKGNNVYEYKINYGSKDIYDEITNKHNALTEQLLKGFQTTRQRNAFAKEVFDFNALEGLYPDEKAVGKTFKPFLATSDHDSTFRYQYVLADIDTNATNHKFLYQLHFMNSLLIGLLWPWLETSYAPAYFQSSRLKFLSDSALSNKTILLNKDQYGSTLFWRLKRITANDIETHSSISKAKIVANFANAKTFKITTRSSNWSFANASDRAQFKQLTHNYKGSQWTNTSPGTPPYFYLRITPITGSNYTGTSQAFQPSYDEENFSLEVRIDYSTDFITNQPTQMFKIVAKKVLVLKDRDNYVGAGSVAVSVDNTVDNTVKRTITITGTNTIPTSQNLFPLNTAMFRAGTGIALATDTSARTITISNTGSGSGSGSSSSETTSSIFSKLASSFLAGNGIIIDKNSGNSTWTIKSKINEADYASVKKKADDADTLSKTNQGTLSNYTDTRNKATAANTLSKDNQTKLGDKLDTNKQPTVSAGTNVRVVKTTNNGIVNFQVSSTASGGGSGALTSANPQIDKVMKIATTSTTDIDQLGSHWQGSKAFSNVISNDITGANYTYAAGSSNVNLAPNNPTVNKFTLPAGVYRFKVWFSANLSALQARITDLENTDSTKATTTADLKGITKIAGYSHTNHGPYLLDFEFKVQEGNRFSFKFQYKTASSSAGTELFNKDRPPTSYILVEQVQPFAVAATGPDLDKVKQDIKDLDSSLIAERKDTAKIKLELKEMGFETNKFRIHSDFYAESGLTNSTIYNRYSADSNNDYKDIMKWILEGLSKHLGGIDKMVDYEFFVESPIKLGGNELFYQMNAQREYVDLNSNTGDSWIQHWMITKQNSTYNLTLNTLTKSSGNNFDATKSLKTGYTFDTNFNVSYVNKNYPQDKTALFDKITHPAYVKGNEFEIEQSDGNINSLANILADISNKSISHKQTDDLNAIEAEVFHIQDAIGLVSNGRNKMSINGSGLGLGNSYWKSHTPSLIAAFRALYSQQLAANTGNRYDYAYFKTDFNSQYNANDKLIQTVINELENRISSFNDSYFTGVDVHILFTKEDNNTDVFRTAYVWTTKGQSYKKNNSWKITHDPSVSATNITYPSGPNNNQTAIDTAFNAIENYLDLSVTAAEYKGNKKTMQQILDDLTSATVLNQATTKILDFEGNQKTLHEWFKAELAYHFYFQLFKQSQIRYEVHNNMTGSTDKTQTTLHSLNDEFWYANEGLHTINTAFNNVSLANEITYASSTKLFTVKPGLYEYEYGSIMYDVGSSGPNLIRLKLQKRNAANALVDANLGTDYELSPKSNLSDGGYFGSTAASSNNLKFHIKGVIWIKNTMVLAPQYKTRRTTTRGSFFGHGQAVFRSLKTKQTWFQLIKVDSGVEVNT